MNPNVYAYDTQVEFANVTGHAAVVEMGKPWHFVFWEKASYVGCIQLDKNTWFSSEWCETNSPNDLHCYEPIMDKELRWSKISILESGPARVRVKWTYALNDIRYRIFHGNTTAEEIFTIYPDGIAVREVILWPGTENNFGGNPNFWQVGEWILINAAGTGPEDVLETPTPFTFLSGTGEKINIPWPLPEGNGIELGAGPLCKFYPQIVDWPMYIGRLHIKKQANPFFGFIKDQRLFPYIHCFTCDKDHPSFNLFTGKNLQCVWHNWPANDMENFVGWTYGANDIGKMTVSTSWIDVNFAMRSGPKDYIPTPFPGTTWYILFGAMEGDEEDYVLERLFCSYSNPASISVWKNIEDPVDQRRGDVLFEGFDYSTRAYTFRIFDKDRIDFSMTPQKPIVNPVFSIKGLTCPPKTGPKNK